MAEPDEETVDDRVFDERLSLIDKAFATNQVPRDRLTILALIQVTAEGAFHTGAGLGPAVALFIEAYDRAALHQATCRVGEAIRDRLASDLLKKMPASTIAH